MPARIAARYTVQLADLKSAASMPPSRKKTAPRPKPRSSLAFDPTLLEDDDDEEPLYAANAVRGSVVGEGGRRRSTRLSGASELSDTIPTPPPKQKTRKRRPSPPQPLKPTSKRAKAVAADTLEMPPPPPPRSTQPPPADADSSSTANDAGSLKFKFSTVPPTTPSATARADLGLGVPPVNAVHSTSNGDGPANKGKRKAELASSKPDPTKRAKRPIPNAAVITLDSTPRQGPSTDRQAVNSTGSIHVYGKQDWTVDTMSKLPTAETPMQVKNQLLRRGDDTSALTFGGTERRRVSMDRRGGRGSSIGTGFDALPHPHLSSSELFRHIAPEQPPPVRMRTLLSWCSQRVQANLLMSTSHGTEVDALVQNAVGQFVKGVCERKVDISWYGAVPPQSTETNVSESDASLPPHPENVSNEGKMKELDAWEQRMLHEDSSRQRLLRRYSDLSTLMQANMSRPASQLVTSHSLYFTLPPTSEPLDFSDVSKMIEFGKRLRSNQPPEGWGKEVETTTNQEEDNGKNRRKSKLRGRPSTFTIPEEVETVNDGDTVSVDSIVGNKWSDLRSNIATLNSQLHRLDQTCQLVESLTSKRLTSSYSRLTCLTSSSTSRLVQPPMVNNSSGSSVRRESTILTNLSRQSVGMSSLMNQSVTIEKCDARDLLRAIAKEDVRGRTS